MMNILTSLNYSDVKGISGHRKTGNKSNCINNILACNQNNSYPGILSRNSNNERPSGVAFCSNEAYFRKVTMYDFLAMKGIEGLSKTSLEEAKNIEVKLDSWLKFPCQYDINKKTITINYYMVKSKEDKEQLVKAFEYFQKVEKDKSKAIEEIVDKSLELYKLDKRLKPSVNLIYLESAHLGYFSLTENKLYLNSYWLEGVDNADVMMAHTILHEMSHLKSASEFTSLPLNDVAMEIMKDSELLSASGFSPAYMAGSIRLPDRCQNLLPVVSKGSPDYDRIMWHSIREIKDKYLERKKQPADSVAAEQYIKINKHLASLCGLEYREFNLVSMVSLLEEGKIVSRKGFTEIFFNKERQKEILKKIEANKDKVFDYLRQNKEVLNTFLKDNGGYFDIYDEALARFNSSLGLLKLIEMGILPDNESSRAVVKVEMNDLKYLVFKQDDEVKGKIESGEIQLDADTLGFLKRNSDYFEIDLSNQKNGLNG